MEDHKNQKETHPTTLKVLWIRFSLLVNPSLIRWRTRRKMDAFKKWRRPACPTCLGPGHGGGGLLGCPTCKGIGDISRLAYKKARTLQ